MGGSPPRDTYDAFTGGLRELGYVDGRNITLEVRWDGFDAKRTPQIAAEFTRLPLTAIFAGTSAFATEASRLIKNVPIVAILIVPLESGVVGELARPAANVTGIAMVSPELFHKRLELLKEAMPKLKRVAVVTIAGEMGALYLKQSQSAAARLGMEVIPSVLNGPEELETVVASVAAQGAEALVTTQGPLFRTLGKRIAALALERRMPTITGETGFAVAGGLMNYGPNIPATYRRAAFYVDRVLKGAKPAELPIEQPTQFELVINLGTAKALGINVPTALLVRADQIIQ
jgi:putative ABC transport system substrate-binding protein